MTGSNRDRTPEQDQATPSAESLVVAGYVLGDLSEKEAHTLQTLLIEQPSLHSELNALQASLEQVYGIETAPPAALRQRVLAQASLSEPKSPDLATLPTRPEVESKTEQGPDRRRPKRRWLSAGWGAIAASLIVALGVQNYTLRQTIQTLQSAPVESAVPDTLIYYLTPTDNDQLREIEVIVDPDQLDVTLNADGLPPLEAGQVYALWTVVAEDAPITKDDKNAILTAVFTGEETISQSQTITVPLVFRNGTASALQDRGLIKAIAVTIEDADAPQRHQAGPTWIQRL